MKRTAQQCLFGSRNTLSFQTNRVRGFTSNLSRGTLPDSVEAAAYESESLQKIGGLADDAVSALKGVNTRRSGGQQSKNGDAGRGENRNSKRANPRMEGPGRQQTKKSKVLSSAKLDTRSQDTSKEEEEEAQLIDVEYIQKHFSIPSQNDYPNAHGGLFGQLHKLPEHLTRELSKIDVKLHHNVEQVRKASSPLHKYTLTAKFGGEFEEITIGRASNVRAASVAAHLHLLSKLHESGTLKYMVFFKNPPTSFVTEHIDSKIDVYHYAARYGLIPEFSAMKFKPPWASPSYTPSYTTVSVRLPAHNIDVSATMPSGIRAEIAASVKFMEIANPIVANSPPDAGEVTTLMNMDTAMKFTTFYSNRLLGATMRTSSTEVVDEVTKEVTYKSQVLNGGDFIGEAVTFPQKKKSFRLAHLVAAVSLKMRNSSLWESFCESFISDRGSILSSILPRLPPVELMLSPTLASKMEDTVLHATELGLPGKKLALSSDENMQQPRELERRRKLSPREIERRNVELREKASRFQHDPRLVNLRESRALLPIMQYRTAILEHINGNQYSVIVGATGSGKTTQVPQILLEDAIARASGTSCNVLCTQPRRIAAISVAQRVAKERNEYLRDTVGYQIRYDSQLPYPIGCITYCTTGILLRQLHSSPDEIFDSFSHIIVDEVHERDVSIDFLLTLLKQVTLARQSSGKPSPKIVLMSATINPSLFTKYFEMTTQDGKTIECPSITIPGRTFPVVEKYLEDVLEELETTHGKQLIKSMHHDDDTSQYLEMERKIVLGLEDNSGNAQSTLDLKSKRLELLKKQSAVESEESLMPIALIAATIAHIAETKDDGAILVFLPGHQEITAVQEELLQRKPLGIQFDDTSLFRIMMLHSVVNPRKQAEAFEPVASGCRKIILSTNIAETSVTIPDIKYVVDSGKLREQRYDPHRRITKLESTWISKSNAKQRAGRAGRVRKGNYYALYSKRRFDSLKPSGKPELLRSDLQKLCLSVKAQSFDMPLQKFLASAIEPPPEEHIAAAINSLKGLEALTKQENLTALGRLLANIPVEPSLGKMVVLGVIFRCLDPMIIIAAASGERDVLRVPAEFKDQARAAHRSFLGDTEGDHLALIYAVRAGRLIDSTLDLSELEQFCARTFLHFGAFLSVMQSARQIERVLIQAGLFPDIKGFEHNETQFGHPSLNVNASSVPLIKALLLYGLHPNLAVLKASDTLQSAKETGVRIHPTSQNYKRIGKTVERSYPQGTLFTYSQMRKTTDGKQTLLKDTTVATPLSVALFGGTLHNVQDPQKATHAKLDDWVGFRAKNRKTMQIVMGLKDSIETVLANSFESLRNLKPPSPDQPTEGSALESELKRTIKALIASSPKATVGDTAQDLSRSEPPENDMEQERLAEEADAAREAQVRETIVKGVVEILAKDAQENEPALQYRISEDGVRNVAKNDPLQDVMRSVNWDPADEPAFRQVQRWGV